MCVAIYKPANVAVPSLDILEMCWYTNPDGAGMAFPSLKKPNMLEIRKGFMEWEDFEEAYQKLELDKMYDRPLFLHFRIATAGNVDAGNTHPFPISQYQETLRLEGLYSKYALIHNGILSEYTPENGTVSDTMQFIMEMARSGRNPMKIFRRMGKRISDGKMALMDKRGRVHLLGEWIDYEGVKFSNELWQLGFWYDEMDDDMDLARSEYEEMFPDGIGATFEEFLWEQYPELYEKHVSEKYLSREFGNFRVIDYPRYWEVWG